MFLVLFTVSCVCSSSDDCYVLTCRSSSVLFMSIQLKHGSYTKSLWEEKVGKLLDRNCWVHITSLHKLHLFTHTFPMRLKYKTAVRRMCIYLCSAFISGSLPPERHNCTCGLQCSSTFGKAISEIIVKLQDFEVMTQR